MLKLGEIQRSTLLASPEREKLLVRSEQALCKALLSAALGRVPLWDASRWHPQPHHAALPLPPPPPIGGESPPPYPSPWPFLAGVPDQKGWRTLESLGSFPPRVVAEDSRFCGVCKGTPRRRAEGQNRPRLLAASGCHIMGEMLGTQETQIPPWFLSSGSRGMKLYLTLKCR